MSSQPEDPLLQHSYQNAYPTYPTASNPQQGPTYNVLPNEQVQMIYTLPAGAIPLTPYQYPQNMYGQPPQPQYMHYPSPVVHVSSTWNSLYTTALATYCVGLFSFFPHIVSLIVSFIMVNKGYIVAGKKPVVLKMAILELITWLFCVSFSWYYVPSDCNSYGVCFETMYWGWIAIVIWWVVALSCGIPRVVLSKPQLQNN